MIEENVITAQQKVKNKWPSARVVPGIADARPHEVKYAVFVGTSTLNSGNGTRRKSGWFATENSAWLDAASRITELARVC